MKRLLALALIFAGLASIDFSSAVAKTSEKDLVAAGKEYKYKCTRNGKIHTYDKPGNYKCPDHKDHNLIKTK